MFAFDLGYGPMALVTSPHQQTNVTMVLPSECPHGTVVPEDAELANRNGIPNTGEYLLLLYVQCVTAKQRTLADAFRQQVVLTVHRG